jgi:COMPASS component SPP1
MVFCEGPCHDWYHCQCIKLDEADTAELLDRFICSKCTTETMFTTWKRMCRNWNIDNTHRKAARVNEYSKYCSDKCLVEFWQFVYDKFRDDNEPSKGGALNREEVGMILHAVGTAAGLHALGKKPTLPVEPGRDPGRCLCRSNFILLTLSRSP